MRFRLAFMVLVSTAAFLPSSAAPQSIVAGGIEGAITDAAGLPVRGTLLTMRQPGGAGSRVIVVGEDGRFSVPFLSPGLYELLAEALGHRPVLVDGLRVDPGKGASVRIVLPASAPPVERRDTLHQAGLPQAIGASLAWLTPGVLRALPDPGGDLAPIAALSGRADDRMGLDGLPEDLTVVYIDGQPFRPARHPGASGDPARGWVMPSNALARMATLGGTEDVEWAGGNGGVLSLSSGVPRIGAPEGFGLWAGDATSSGGAVPDSPPPFTSGWGGVGVTVPLLQDTALLHVALQTSRAQRAAPALVSDSIGTLIKAGGSPFSSPSIEEVTRTSGSARVEWSLAGGSAFHASLGGVSFSTDRQLRPAPELRYSGSEPTFKGADGYATANLLLDLADPYALEVRVGATMSRRDFSPTASGDADTGPATMLLDPAVGLNGDPGLGGEVRRTEFGGEILGHVTSGVHRLKLGIQTGLASFRYDVLDNGRGTYLFEDARTLRGQGWFIGTTGSANSVSFNVPTVGGLAQYRWSPSPSVALTVGARYDVSKLPLGDVKPDERWAKLTGIINASIPAKVTTAGGQAHLTWDPSGTGRTVLVGGVALDHGEVDPGALYEVIQNNGHNSIRRVAGTFPSWPATPPADAGTTAASLSLLGPGVTAPRTARGEIGIAHQFGAGPTVRAMVTTRRTELLLRRADVNAPLGASSVSDDGRGVFAPLMSSGGIVGPVPGSWRRFSAYDAVWAFNADGWSTYRALALALERPLPRGGVVFMTYTRSETRDNLFGLTRERPWAALVPKDSSAAKAWEEGTSDLDVPDRATIGVVLGLPRPLPGTIGGTFRFSSGLPFTPMVREGSDVNGDGSWMNDVARVPETVDVAEPSVRACLSASLGSVPERNSCRGPSLRQLDLRFALGPVSLGSLPIDLVVDVVNATDQATGIRDDALLLVDPKTPITTVNGRVSIPYVVNSSFGALRVRTDPGRLLRIGLRVGGPKP